MMGKRRRREGGRKGAWRGRRRRMMVEIDETDVGYDHNDVCMLRG